MSKYSIKKLWSWLIQLFKHRVKRLEKKNLCSFQEILLNLSKTLANQFLNRTQWVKNNNKQKMNFWERCSYQRNMTDLKVRILNMLLSRLFKINWETRFKTQTNLGKSLMQWLKIKVLEWQNPSGMQLYNKMHKKRKKKLRGKN